MRPTDQIDTSVEAEENAILPRLYEVHADPDARPGPDCVPEPLNKPYAGKSPAQWAYERLMLYIQNLESRLDAEHEVAMGFTGSEAGVLRIEGMGYFDPDILTFYGTDLDGVRTQMVQHVTQLSVMLRALPKPKAEAQARRIGFRLAEELGAEPRAQPQAKPE